MKSLRLLLLITGVSVLAGAAFIFPLSGPAARAGAKEKIRYDVVPQGSPREQTIRNIARQQRVSLAEARKVLDESEKRLGYKVFDRLSLPGNASVDYVDLTGDQGARSAKKRDTLLASANKVLPGIGGRRATTRGHSRCGIIAFGETTDPAGVGYDTQGSNQCEANNGLGWAVGPGRTTSLGGLSQFPGARTSGEFRVLVVAIQFPSWADKNPERQEPHGDCKKDEHVGLSNPTWNQVHPTIDRFSTAASLQSNVALQSAWYSLLVDPSNPYGARNWLTQVSHDNAHLDGTIADVIPWITEGAVGASSHHQLDFGLNVFLGAPFRIFNVPVGPHFCPSETDLTVFTWGDIKSLFTQFGWTKPGDRQLYRLKSYDYYTHHHDLKPNINIGFNCGDRGVTAGVDPYQLTHVSLSDDGKKEVDLPSCHADRPVPMDCDLNETIYHGGVSYIPTDPPEDYSLFTNLNFHSGMGLVRDVSQILVDRRIVPGVNAAPVTEADFSNRYDLLIVVVPDPAAQPFIPMQISPLPRIPENLGTSSGRTPEELGYPAAPAVSIPSMVLPAGTALNPTAVPTPGGTGLARVAHLLGHLFGFVDTTDRFGFTSAAVSPYTVMQNGIRLDPWHTKEAGWVKPIVITDDRMQVQLPAIENSLTNPIIYKVPADLNNVNGPEYFLLENHQSSGASYFGDNTPAGLYVWHVDERFGPINAPNVSSDIPPIPPDGSFFLNPNRGITDYGDGGFGTLFGFSNYSSINRSGSLNGDEDNYFMGLLEADGLRNLSKGVINMAGDPFPGSANRTEVTQHTFDSSGNALPFTRFNPTLLSQPPTTDNLSLARRFRSAGDTYVRINGISAPGGAMTFNVWVKPREIVMEPTSLVFIQTTQAKQNTMGTAGACNPAGPGDTVAVTYAVTGTDQTVNPAVPLTVVGLSGPAGANGTGAGDITKYKLESPIGTPIDLQGLFNSGKATIGYLPNGKTTTATITLPPCTLAKTYKLAVSNLNYQRFSGDTTGSPFGTSNVSQGTVNDIIGITATAGQGQTNVPILKIHMRHTTQAQDIIASTGNVTINEFRLDASGTSKNDTDIKRVTLFEDSNGDGVLDPNVDRAIATGTMTSQTLRFTNLQYEIPLNDPRGRDWFITYDISQSAQTNPLITVGGRVDNVNYIKEVVPGAVRERNYSNGNFLFPFASAPLTIIQSQDTLTFSPTSLAPSLVDQGQADVPMEALKLSVNRDQIVIKSIRVRQPQTDTPVTAISRVKLWDAGTDTSGTFNPTTDKVIKEGIFNKDPNTGLISVTFDDLNYTVVQDTPRVLFVTYSISTTATPGNAVALRILNNPQNANEQDVTLVNNINNPIVDVVSTANFPIQSGVSIIKRAQHTLNVDFSDLAPPQTDPGRVTTVDTTVTPPKLITKGVAMLKLILTPQAGTIGVRSLKVTETGTAGPTAVKLVRIYEDKNNTGDLDDGDLEAGGGALGTGTFDAGKTATIQFPKDATGNPTFTIAEGSSRSLLVVYDIDPSAKVGQTLGANIQTSSDLDVSPDSTNFVKGPPMQSTVSMLRGFLSVSRNDAIPTPATLHPGDSMVVMLALLVQGVKNPNDPTDPQADPVTIKEFQVDLTGTAAAGTVTAIKLYDDSLGSIPGKPEDPTERMGATPPGFNGTFFRFTNLSIPVGITAKQLLITFDIAPTATPGTTVGARFASAASILGDGVVVVGAIPVDSLPSGQTTPQPTPIAQTAPKLVCSSTFVRQTNMTVAFSKPVTAVDATTLGNYKLVVGGVTIDLTGSTVTLRSDGQTVDFTFPSAAPFPLSVGAPYTLTVTSVKDTSGNVIDPTLNSCSDLVKNSTPPTVTGCTADNVGVTVTFGSVGGINPSDAATLANYALESPIATTKDLSKATIAFDNNTQTTKITGLTLKTGDTFKVTVTNVRDVSGNVIDPTKNTCGATKKVVDDIPPRVVSCSAISNQITLTFSEDVQQADAQNLANYSIESPVGILLNKSGVTASYQSSAFTVTLSGFQLNPSDTVKVTVNNVHDIAGNNTDPLANTATCVVGIQVTIPGGSNPDGTKKISLFSIPWDLTNKDPAAIFSGVGFTAPRIARWNPAALSNRGAYVYSDQDPTNFVRIFLGEAYFAAFPQDQTLLVSSGRPLSGSTPFQLNLPPNNWILLGNPYLFDFNWDTTKINALTNGGGTAQSLKSLVGDPSRPVEYYGWIFDAQLQDYVLLGDPSVFVTSSSGSVRGALPFAGGAWLKSNAAGVTLQLPPPSSARGLVTMGPNPSARLRQSEKNWSVELTVDAQDRKSIGNLFGVSESGRGQGILIAAPPFMPETSGTVFARRDLLNLSFLGPTATRDASPFATPYKIDLRPSVSDKATWDFIVNTNLRSAEVTLRWGNLVNVPKRYRLRMIDMTTGVRRAMRTTSFYTFRANAQDSTTRQFRIELFPSSQGGIRVTNLSVAAPSIRSATSGVRFSYLLSHGANVRIRVLTASGRVVKELGPVAVNAGMNLADWDLRNRFGAFIPRGIYLIELIAEDEEGQSFKAIRQLRVQ